MTHRAVTEAQAADDEIRPDRVDIAQTELDALVIGPCLLQKIRPEGAR